MRERRYNGGDSMKVYGNNGQSGLHYYSRELAKILGYEWQDIIPMLRSGKSMDDGLLVISAGSNWRVIPHSSGCVPFWEYYLAPRIPETTGVRFAASQFIEHILGGYVLPIIATPVKCSGPNMEEFTVLYSFSSGSCMFRKNPWCLIKACAMMEPRPKLIIKTDCPRPDWLKDEWVEWIGEHLDSEAYDRIWERATVYVSTHRSEGIGMTLVEAMGRGKPIVSTAYGGCVEFLESEFCDLLPYAWTKMPSDGIHIAYDCIKGICIPEPSVASLVTLLSRLRDDPSRIESMAAAANHKHMDMVLDWQWQTPKIIRMAGFP